MQKFQILCLIFLLLILLFRLQSSWPLDKNSTDSTLENLALNFTPYSFYLSEQIKNLLPETQAALLSGILLGVKEDLPPEFKQALRNTGTIHIVVVSGQNLSMLAGFLMGLVGFFGRRKTIILTLIIVWLYCLLTGLQIPVIRAGIMVTLAFLAQLTGREQTGWWILCISAILMLIYQPNWLLSISFQLSFVATLGVVVVAPVLFRSINFLPNLLKQDLVVSLSTWLLTLPIIAINFHQASLLGILVNSLILWTIPLIMITGTIAVLTSFLLFPIALLLSFIPGILLTYFIYIVSFFNTLSMSSVYVPKIPLMVWLGYYLIIAGIIWALQKRKTEESNKELDLGHFKLGL